MDLYEYAIIRYVPDIEREEFVNIGLIMLCKRKRWLKSRVDIASRRIYSLAQPTDPQHISRAVYSFTAINDRPNPGDPISQLEPEERFRWLTAVKSACISTSRPHPGLTDDLEKTFDELFARLVL